MIDAEKLVEILEKSGSDLKPAADDFGKPFSDIGLDSLDVYNLLVEVELAVGRKISDDDFQRINSLSDIIKFFNA